MKVQNWPKGVWALLILGAIGLLITPKIQLLKADDSEKSGDKKEDKGVPVHATVVQPEQLANTLKASGTLTPAKAVSLKTESSGRITKLPLEEGEKVQKGQLLLKINSEELEASLQEAEHRKKLLKEQVARKKELLAKEGISQESYDQTKTELASIKAEIENIKAQINKREIRAPFSGTLGLKQVAIGSYVSPATEVINLVQLAPLKIDFSVPGKYSRYIQEGKDIHFKVNGRDTQFKASIYAQEPSIDASTRTLQLRALYPNANKTLVPGSFADISLTLSTNKKALMVPAIAVIPELQGKKVFLYKNGKAYSQKITAGQRTNKQVQVADGIQPGDTIITKGVQKLKDGAPVSIQAMN